MRLLVYYNPRKDIFVTNYKEDRHLPIELMSYNCYGNIVVQYLYIIDNKVFYNYKSYSRYFSKKYKTNKITSKSIRYSIGQAIIKFGKYICFGKQEKVKYVYVYRYPWWK